MSFQLRQIHRALPAQAKDFTPADWNPDLTPADLTGRQPRSQLPERGIGTVSGSRGGCGGLLPGAERAGTRLTRAWGRDPGVPSSNSPRPGGISSERRPDSPGPRGRTLGEGEEAKIPGLHLAEATRAPHCALALGFLKLGFSFGPQAVCKLQSGASEKTKRHPLCRGNPFWGRWFLV